MRDAKDLYGPSMATGDEERSWELFHENSKISTFDIPPSDHEVLARMAEVAECLVFHGYPVVPLPEEALSLTMPLGDAIRRRSTTHEFIDGPVHLRTVATLLRCAYGVTRDQRAAGYPRAFRTVPSAGAMYPLELYVHSARTVDFEPGLYHYNPIDDHLRLIRPGDHSTTVAEALVQQSLARDTSLIVFITAVMDRTTFKYGERGYRFALIESGHVAQNINLAAAGLGLGTVNIGGFYDRRVDEFLDLDGLTHSTLYAVAVGTPRPVDEARPV